MRKISVGKIYKHYKGKLYKVTAIAVDTEATWIDDPAKITDAQRRVIYHAIGEGHALDHDIDIVWDRPYEMFAGTLTVDGKEMLRFVEQE